MSATISTVPRKEHRPFTRAQSIGLVFCCTILGAAAQVLMKIGANHPPYASLAGYLTNLPLFAGYCLYGMNAVLLIFALRDGELSILYPIIALTYVWVTILSVVFFNERINFLKAIGVLTVIFGVAVLGRGGKR